MSAKLDNCLSGEKNGDCHCLEDTFKAQILINAEKILHVTFMTNGKKETEVNGGIGDEAGNKSI